MNCSGRSLFVCALMALTCLGLGKVAEAQCIPYSGASGFESTNGRKVAVGPGNRLHVVFLDPGSGGQVKYTSSTDGITWDGIPSTLPADPPFVVSAGGSNRSPTIAVDAAGSIGIAWSDGGVRYRSRTSSGTWNATFLVEQYGEMPSIASVGTAMHLAWLVVDMQLRYAAFSTLQPSTALNNTIDSDSAGEFAYHRPSIAIAPASGIMPAVIQVAVGIVRDRNVVVPAVNEIGAGVRVFRQNPSNLWIWKAIYDDVKLTANPSTSNFAIEAVSLSASAGPSASGDFFLASSLVNDNVATTRLVRTNFNTGDWTASVQLVAGRTIVGVTSRKSSTENFRVAYSTLPGASPAVYGTVTYLAGTWTGTSSYPTFNPSTTVDTSGRAPQPVFWSRCSGTTKRNIHLVFDDQASLNYEICPYSTLQFCLQFPVVKVGRETYRFTNGEIGNLAAAVAEVEDRRGEVLGNCNASLLVKLVAADKQIATCRVACATCILGAFAGEVRAQSGKKLALDDALLFVGMTSEVIARLN